MFQEIIGSDCEAFVNPGYNTLTGSYAAPKETLEYLAREHVVEVDIHVPLQLFREFITGQIGGLPLELQPLVKEVDQLINLPGVITPPMQVALQQILHCPYQGMFKRMYLESKVLELMSLQLIQVVEQEEIPHACRSLLRASDIDCIHHAKAILRQNFENPPSLLDLARQVGLNDRKLKQGFHQVFNTTPFAYLRDHRLERARQLLMDSEIPIEQVAKAVGYGDRSRFAAAFRKKFGINPKTYQLQWQREI